MDAGAGDHADRLAVPGLLHAARHVVSAAPDRVHAAGSGAPGRGADEAAIAAWRDVIWVKLRGERRRPARTVLHGRRPGRPCAPRRPGPGPAAVTLRSPWCLGKGFGRVSAAGLACFKPGVRGRFFYRIRIHRGRKGERRSLSACATPDQLAAIMKNRLKRIQHRPELIGGFLGQTGLSLEPEPP